MPELGEIHKAEELGYKSRRQKYIWHACEICGKERWVRVEKGKPSSHCCPICANAMRGRRGDKHPTWKGGQHCYRGYVTVTLLPDDFFYPMADKQHHVMKHRLVMAKHLNRCLLSWEVVHHKNSIKDDNRLENLELLPSQKQHLPSTQWRRELTKRDKKIAALGNQLELQAQQIKLLQWHIKELNEQKINKEV